jgi:hypothetical protein
VGGKVSPPHYIKGPLGGELDTHGLRELLGRALLSSPPLVPVLSPLSLMWTPEGLRRSEGDSTTHDKVLQEF